jgi:hypothetical protein
LECHTGPFIQAIAVIFGYRNLPTARVLRTLTAMKHIQHILSALCVCAFTASAQVTLEFKQTEKSTVTVQSDVNLKQTLQIAGQEIQTRSIQKFTTQSVTGDRAHPRHV